MLIFVTINQISPALSDSRVHCPLQQIRKSVGLGSPPETEVVNRLSEDLSAFVAKEGRLPSASSSVPEERLSARVLEMGIRLPGFVVHLSPHAKSLIRDFRPRPSKRTDFSVVRMQSAFLGEDEGKDILSPVSKKWIHFETKYLRTETERAPYRLIARDGKIYGADGKPFDTSGAELKGLSNSTGRAMLVMDQHGSLYAMKDQVRGLLHHTTLLGGEPVAFAGEIIVKEGILTLIGNKAGHYHTPTSYFAQLLEQLDLMGVNVRKPRLEIFGD